LKTESADTSAVLSPLQLSQEKAKTANSAMMIAEYVFFSFIFELSFP
jgi:hypothetical protein